MTQKRLRYAAHGLEATAGTNVPTTFKHRGDWQLEFDDHIVTPGFDYPTGYAGGIVTTNYVSETGALLTLPDSDATFEGVIWLMQSAIKAVTGSQTTFTYGLATTAAQTPATFSWECVTAVQAYEFSYGFTEKWNINGNAHSDNGRIKYNRIVRGRKVTTTTATASMGFLANEDFMLINNSSIKLDALGTAAGTASATSNWLKGISLDCETGFFVGKYADGRSTLDFSTIDGGGVDYKLTGEIEAVFNATGVTQLANARAGTAAIMQWLVNGNNSRSAKFNMPFVYTAAPKLNEDEVNGLVIARFPFQVGYDTTSTAQGPSVIVVPSGATTVT